jgi:uncharacterized membrane protein
MIIEQARMQTAHRIDIEKRVVYANTRHQTVGLLCGTLILLSVLALAGFAIAHGQTVGGLFTGFATVVAAVASYVWGVTQQRSERVSKRQESQAQLPPTQQSRKLNR